VARRLRFGLWYDFRNPPQWRQDPTELYRAIFAQIERAEALGWDDVWLSEHHFIADGYTPSMLALATAIAARTQRIEIGTSVLLLPLHDPLRVAEDIAVLDNASGGRLTTILGIGYRPSEYAAHGKDWTQRGALMDECVDTLLKSWTGEPFEYRGTTVRVTPRPFTQPHPTILLGGTSKPAARRAARFGLPMFAAAYMPELEGYYYEQCMEQKTQGFFMMPGESTVMLHVAEDPDRAWAELGDHFFHEAATYASWQTEDISSAVHSYATTPEELRAEGIYQVLSPDQVVERVKAAGDEAFVNLHPLVGGMPIDEGWKCLQLYVDEVLPRVS